MQNKLRKDSTPDFIKIAPERITDTMPLPQINMDKYREMCREVSAEFIKYPEIYSSQISFEYVPETVYYVNSEGREYIKNNMYGGVEISAFTQAEDGMPISNFYSVYAINPNDLPAQDSIMKAATNVVKSLLAVKQAKSIDEAYSGPVLFSSQAAGEIFAQVFAPQLISQREMMTEQGKQSADKYSAFQNRQIGRITPLSPCRHEGAKRVVTLRRCGLRWTLAASGGFIPARRNAVGVRRSRRGLAPRPWRLSVLPCGGTATVTRTAAHRGDCV